MKVVTINVHRSYLKAIEKLVGDDGLYPSRSELIRAAVRKLLLNELEEAKRIKERRENPPIQKKHPEKFVQVPIEKESDDGDPIREFKTYRIIRKLEF
jgi:Arc/MetJ-type ribon-helix-helix transcriptional regulator